MTERAEKAVNAHNSGFNCCQAMLLAYADGLDESTALKIAAGFGGGIGRMGRACGAVTGAIMVLGWKHGPVSQEDLPAAKARVAELARRFITLFEERNGTTECRKLLGFDIGNPAELDRAKQSGYFLNRCGEVIRSASSILEELD